MFGKEIEPMYNDIVKNIEKENLHISFNIKERLIKWIFYTKMRSPIWEIFTDERKNKLTSKNRYSQHLNLENFTNEKCLIISPEIESLKIVEKLKTEPNK